jgi:hypothetical protein
MSDISTIVDTVCPRDQVVELAGTQDQDGRPVRVRYAGLFSDVYPKVAFFHPSIWGAVSSEVLTRAGTPEVIPHYRGQHFAFLFGMNGRCWIELVSVSQDSVTLRYLGDKEPSKP